MADRASAEEKRQATDKLGVIEKPNLTIPGNVPGSAHPEKAPFPDGSGRGLYVHSGKCCLCQTGIGTGAFDFKGREIHTGDIVSLYRAEDGEDGPIELFTPLTVVIADQFQSFSNGAVKLVERPMQFFSMGIKNVGISSPEWPVSIVKKYHDVVEGEHWPAWGFSYRQNEAADAALSKATGGQHV